MIARIQGMGWITPLGGGLDEVWTRCRDGEQGEIRELTSAESGKTHHYYSVPPKLTEALERNPRLRRSSAISLFAASAGMAALENAGIKMTPETSARTAIIFAIASGGVIYTRRFYEQIVKGGTNTASPLLFPETVYNAPASHLAALLGIDGASYTLVGDQSVGISALKFAEQLLATTDVKYCVVVGAEEVDAILCDAYRAWRLLTSQPRLEPGSNRGTLLAEGAAALVLGREGKFQLAAIHDGASFFRRIEAAGAVRKVLGDLAKNSTANFAVTSANGTFIDAMESDALDEFFPAAKVLRSKQALGEALGAGALMQTILGALALENHQANSALISVLGFNQQASGGMLTVA